MTRILYLLIIFIIFDESYGENFIYADPFNLLKVEQKFSFDSTSIPSLTIRPLIKNINNYNLELIARSEFYYNSSAPNFENMGNRFIAKGFGFFTSINLSYTGKYFSLSIEPFYITSQNKALPINGRDGMFYNLNDNPKHRLSYLSAGLRETQLYFHFRELGFGFSNANMWWGPGLHNTLTMTNNTTSFPHLMIGTVNEKRINKIGINLRYIFSKLDKTIGDPYFTALVGTLRYYSNPLITIGLSRNYLSGGLPTDRPFTRLDAALIVFEQLLIDTKLREYPPEWDAHDPWDQTMAGFIMLDFPESKLRLFVEIGTNDHRQNFSDLRTHPDHALAYILGMRKYGFFRNENLVAGFEYTNLILGKFWDYRATPNWYNRASYDYSSYDGLRWAAHSGSDSDDFFIYFGYQNDKWSFIPAFNYERHGVIYTRQPEVKMEIRFDFRYSWGEYRINMFFEREWIEHAGFIPNKWRIGNVVWFGIERDITKMLSNKIRLPKK
tara:strand:+ start:875 stop:2362 length:1488 start_codon:yes stop_codon:yes gene_type:complete